MMLFHGTIVFKFVLATQICIDCLMLIPTVLSLHFLIHANVISRSSLIPNHYYFSKKFFCYLLSEMFCDLDIKQMLLSVSAVQVNFEVSD